MSNEPLRLHIGGRTPLEGWKILNIQAGPDVDYQGDCTDLSRFDIATIDTIYASHVLEHLGYQQELPKALGEFHRVLKPHGELLISVPDLMRLAKLFAHPDIEPKVRFYIMRVMFGGQMDEHDFHKVGLTFEILAFYLKRAGFSKMQRVESFGLFRDSSEAKIAGVSTSLNIKVSKK